MPDKPQVYRFNKEVDRKVKEGQSPLFNWFGKGVPSKEHFRARVKAQMEEREREGRMAYSRTKGRASK